MKKKFAIIGAGIAGLTLANLIKKKSEHKFMLYERQESLSLDQGYGIQLSTNSTKILNILGFSKLNSEKIFHPKSVDFYEITRRTLNVSKEFCKGNVVSILEGGYNLEALSESCEEHIKSLMES